jgi:hypothetical protein
VKILKGNGEPGGIPKEGTGKWAMAEGDEPENAGRRETRGRRATGRTRRANGKPEESLRGEPEDVR